MILPLLRMPWSFERQELQVQDVSQSETTVWQIWYDIAGPVAIQAGTWQQTSAVVRMWLSNAASREGRVELRVGQTGLPVIL